MLPSGRVTVDQLLATSLDVLFRLQDRSAQDASKATKIDPAILSKFRTGARWPTADQFEAVAKFFKVQPYVLLKPDEAMRGRIVDIRQSENAHGVAKAQGDPVDSPSPIVETGGATVHEDQGLWSDIRAFWDVMSPDDRAELWKVARRLRDQQGGGQSVFGRR